MCAHLRLSDPVDSALQFPWVLLVYVSLNFTHSISGRPLVFLCVFRQKFCLALVHGMDGGVHFPLNKIDFSGWMAPGSYVHTTVIGRDT